MMKNKAKTKQPQKAQSELFKETAKSLVCNESKQAFEEKLKNMVKKKGKNKDICNQ